MTITNVKMRHQCNHRTTRRKAVIATTATARLMRASPGPRGGGNRSVSGRRWLAMSAVIGRLDAMVQSRYVDLVKLAVAVLLAPIVSRRRKRSKETSLGRFRLPGGYHLL